MPVTVFLIVAASLTLHQVAGHGMMLRPTNRASLWRFHPSEPVNTEDNEFFCGGVEVQYDQNGGKCGPCGDNYADAQPRANENTGTYGNGFIAATYTSGSVINVLSKLTANHLGTITFALCILNDATKPEDEECFTDLTLADGSSAYIVGSSDYFVNNEVKLPDGVTCERCVLRWHYRCGNSWGVCEDGTGKLGCGDQEIFRSCADITIV